VSLPGIEVEWIKAKLDTGARSSSIHAFDTVVFTRDGAAWVRFGIHPWQDSDEDVVEVECPVLDRREVRSSNGQSEERLVVPMQVRLVGELLDIEMTLSRRDEMGFRMLLGRSALEQGFLVDSSASYVGGKPPVRIRRRNRGR
jgi:hypothetical protein